jgi:hypothetical protein
MESVWPRGSLLQGADSTGLSIRQQSALGILARGRSPELAGAYVKRLAPPREVIDLRAGSSHDPYAVALLGWRLSQVLSRLQTNTEDINAEDQESA